MYILFVSAYILCFRLYTTSWSAHSNRRPGSSLLLRALSSREAECLCMESSIRWTSSALRCLRRFTLLPGFASFITAGRQSAGRQWCASQVIYPLLESGISSRTPTVALPPQTAQAWPRERAGYVGMSVWFAHLETIAFDTDVASERGLAEARVWREWTFGDHAPSTRHWQRWFENVVSCQWTFWVT